MQGGVCTKASQKGYQSPVTYPEGLTTWEVREEVTPGRRDEGCLGRPPGGQRGGKQMLELGAGRG